MHNIYLDEMYTQQRVADFMQEAARAKEIRNIEKMMVKKPNVVRAWGDGGSLQIKIVMARVENDRRITVEVR